MCSAEGQIPSVSQRLGSKLQVFEELDPSAQVPRGVQVFNSHFD